MVTAAWVKEQGLALGFDRVGIAPATDLPELAFFPEWLARGYAGMMDYLGNPKRGDVRELLPEARSVICGALVYDTAQPRSTEVPPDPARGWVSRYAWGEDYHRVMEEKLEALRDAIAEKLQEDKDPPRGGSLGARRQMKDSVPEPPGSCLGEDRPSEAFECKLYVDTGPVLERVYGKHAGLGWQGKNTCLLDAELGSYFFIGVLVTNLELAPDAPPADACGACTLCLEACPTGALVQPYVMDARRCISYLTIELRESIPEALRAPMGRHVFGCDICQDVCPYNRRAKLTGVVSFNPRPMISSATQNESKIETRKAKTGPGTESDKPQPPSPVAPATGGHSSRTALRAAGAARRSDREGKGESLFHPGLEWLAGLRKEEFLEVFRSSAVRRAKWRGLLRNVLVAMGNSGNPRFRPLLEQFAASDDPLLAEHARWALQRLPAASCV